MSSAIDRKRRYNDACGTALALDIVGDRWALLIVRELLFGPRRFSDLRRDLPGISANMLSRRLEELIANDVVIVRHLPPPAASQVYALTDFGRAAESMIIELGRWAAQSPLHDPSLPLSASSMMLSLKAMLVSRAGPARTLRIGFRIGTDRFVASLDRGELDIVRGEPDDADCDAILDAPGGDAVAAYFYAPTTGNRQPPEIPGVSVRGDRSRLARFRKCFALPPKL